MFAYREWKNGFSFFYTFFKHSNVEKTNVIVIAKYKTRENRLWIQRIINLSTDTSIAKCKPAVAVVEQAQVAKFVFMVVCSL